MKFNVTYSIETRETTSLEEQEISVEDWASFAEWVKMLESSGCECWYKVVKVERID